ncbi:DUF1440 domain-containing protein [Lactobacillaceae bacterium 24-114]
MTKKINWPLTIAAGLAGGLIGGLVKLGWENILPPRTPERNKTNPPQQLLQQLGVPEKITHATYTYSGQKLPYVSYLIHFGFSCGFGIAYSVGSQLVPWIKKGHGIPAGLVIWDVFHLELLPKLGTIPSIKDQPMEEHISEALGHAIWMWSIDEIIRGVESQEN